MILIVEDDAENAASLREVLQEEGYPIERAADGADALRLLKGGMRPDLMLVDLMMPNIDGWKLATALRADASLQTIPIVLLTADARGKEAAQQLGVNAYLSKPVDLGTLLDTVSLHYRSARPSQ